MFGFKKKKSFTVVRYGEFEEIKSSPIPSFYKKSDFEKKESISHKDYDKLEITVKLLRVSDISDESD